jgi:hypothetical protein
MISSVARRKQVATAATGCCGYNAVKQCLGICDVRQVMLDIKGQVLEDIETMRIDRRDTTSDELALLRVETALQQVDCEAIGASGWFSDFLAVYVAKAYGVTILIIRHSGNFTFVEVQCNYSNTMHVSGPC